MKRTDAVNTLRTLFQSRKMNGIYGWVCRITVEDQEQFNNAVDAVHAVGGKIVQDFGSALMFTASFHPQMLSKIESTTPAFERKKPGVIKSVRFEATDTVINLLDAETDHPDLTLPQNRPYDHRWIVWCVDHEDSASFPIKAAALLAMRDPSCFCWECREHLQYSNKPVSRFFRYDAPPRGFDNAIGFIAPDGTFYQLRGYSQEMIHQQLEAWLIKSFLFTPETTLRDSFANTQIVREAGYMRIDVTSIHPDDPEDMTQEQIATLREMYRVHYPIYPLYAIALLLEQITNNTPTVSSLRYAESRGSFDDLPKSKPCGFCGEDAPWNFHIHTYTCKCGAIRFYSGWMKPNRELFQDAPAESQQTQQQPQEARQAGS